MGKSRVTPLGVVSSETETNTPGHHSDKVTKLIVYCINIRCLLSKFGELQYHLNRMQPHILFIQESWLAKSVEEVDLEGYDCISRKDRFEIENRGGVIAYARNDLGNIVFLANSIKAERSWHLLHTDIGDVILCNWYRPGNSDMEHIESFHEELGKYMPGCIGCLTAGDLNIRHRKW